MILELEEHVVYLGLLASGCMHNCNFASISEIIVVE